jgi:hypothetical protein
MGGAKNVKLLKRTVASVLLMTSLAGSAPLFPDVPENHWAKDAVAALAAKGLVEGYPDGTFKGDRSASRWEVAMIVARLLAKMEQEHATFASKAELDELRKLVNALREELDALGVRVDNLEENVASLDKRVTELERISFYGTLEARVSMQSYQNEGQHFSDPTDAVLDYANLVGTVAGTGGPIPTGPAMGLNFDPFAFGVFTVNNMRTGRPIVNGTGFTTKGTLGVNIRVSDEVDAGAEFVAFASQGNNLTDLYYGLSAPYLSSAFTGQSGGGAVQPLNHTPFTRMTLDNFWVYHQPSNTRLRLGSFSDIHFDELVYQKVLNPGAFGPKFLNSYGFQAFGDVPLTEDESQTLTWELMGTLLPDRNIGPAGASYQNRAVGGNLAYNFARRKGRVKANFLRAGNDAGNGLARQTGLIPVAALGPTPWVNPPGFYFNQLGGPSNATGGIGSLGDKRPIVMPTAGNDGITGVPGTANFGNIGPQGMDSYGLSFRYLWEGDWAPRVQAEYARSNYRPNQNSGYSVEGDAFRITAGATPFESLELDFEYLAVDPTYDPFLFQIPPAGGILFNGMRLGESFLSQRGNLYSLHDTEVYPHNREGFRGKIKWDYSDYGAILFKFGFLDQRQTSLQDARFSAGSLGPGTPNTPVLGFSPGFMDPVFGGFSPFTFASNGVNALAIPLETPRGESDFFSVTAQHNFPLNESESRNVSVTAHFNRTDFTRNSNLAALLGGANGLRGENVNRVDLAYTGWEIGVDYDLTESFTLRGGYGQYSVAGHYDPFGVASEFAVASGSTAFDNFDTVQQQPFIGFDYDISDSITWDLMGTFLSTEDRVSPALFVTPTIAGTNQVFTPQRSAHPFSYEGIMINSSFTLNF